MVHLSREVRVVPVVASGEPGVGGIGVGQAHGEPGPLPGLHLAGEAPVRLPVALGAEHGVPAHGGGDGLGAPGAEASVLQERHVCLACRRPVENLEGRRVAHSRRRPVGRVLRGRVVTWWARRVVAGMDRRVEQDLERQLLTHGAAPSASTPPPRCGSPDADGDGWAWPGPTATAMARLVDGPDCEPVVVAGLVATIDGCANIFSCCDGIACSDLNSGEDGSCWCAVTSVIAPVHRQRQLYAGVVLIGGDEIYAVSRPTEYTISLCAGVE